MASAHVVYTGSGNLEFSNYRGARAGVNFESDNGLGTPGNLRWYFTQSEAVNNSTQIFGNDLILSTPDNLGTVSVSLYDQILPLASHSVARYYTLDPANSGNADLRLYYGDSELLDQVEENLNIWLRRDGVWTNLQGTVNTSLNYVEITGGIFIIQGGVRDSLVLSDAENDNSLPVELISFSAFIDQQKAVLEWATESEIENAYWIIERKNLSRQEFEQITSGSLEYEDSQFPFIRLATVAGQGSKNTSCPSRS